MGQRSNHSPCSSKFPFKGERAKVARIDESREEVVLELIEAAVPIPVTVKADQIRIIQKEAD